MCNEDVEIEYSAVTLGLDQVEVVEIGLPAQQQRLQTELHERYCKSSFAYLAFKAWTCVMFLREA